MGLSLWKKERILRRFKAPLSTGGVTLQDYYDMPVMADVQTTDRSSKTREDGDLSSQELKVFTDEKLHVADEVTGTLGDRLWFQGLWFECKSSRLSENTFLKHWTSTFTQCMDQDDPPEGVSAP